jgi:hypothetical protein
MMKWVLSFRIKLRTKIIIEVEVKGENVGLRGIQLIHGCGPPSRCAIRRGHSRGHMTRGWL